MRTISDHEGIGLLEKIFGLEAPVDFESVKKQYRNLSKKHHPDAGGDEEEFKTLSNAYDALHALFVKRSHIFDSEDKTEPKAELPSITTDGTPLTDLGKGVKFRENGVTCERCSGKGYNLESIPDYGWTTCPSCSGVGGKPRQFECRACRGTGKFTQARSGRTVNCRKCSGTGKFKHPHLKSMCFRCTGTGRIRGEKPSSKMRAFKCCECNGRGETVVDNPVIPNGVIL